MNSKNKELIEIESKITKYIEDMDASLCEPVRAYIIFQDEESY
jgi:hypothetical protein